MNRWQEYDHLLRDNDSYARLVHQLRERHLIPDSFDDFAGMSADQLAYRLHLLPPIKHLFRGHALVKAQKLLAVAKSVIEQANRREGESEEGQRSEYERLSPKIKYLIKRRHLDGLNPSEMSPEQIEWLSSETGLDDTRIVPFVHAVKLSKEWGVPLDTLYGLAAVMKGLDLEKMVRKRPSGLTKVLNKAIDNKIIPSQAKDVTDETINKIHRFSLRHVSLDKFAGIIALNLSPELQHALKGKKIENLAAVLSAGTLQDVNGFPADSEDGKALRTLEAHARLSALSSDVMVNSKLIVKGYQNPITIAKTPLAHFTETMRKDLGLVGSAQLHIEAQALTKYLDNAATSLLADSANHFVAVNRRGDGDLPPTFEKYLPIPCNCADCEAAVSPLAYLADLLDYVLSHVKIGATPITLDYLVRTLLYQPLDQLPADCSFAEKKVRQVRLCIEVLRAYLPPMALHQFHLISKPYRFAAYKMLLTNIGTSYDEMRLVSSEDQAEREALAARLGIREERLNALVLDPQAGPLPPGPLLPALVATPSLTEEQLEALFGLRSTARDPVTDPSAALLQTWRLDYLRENWRKQDWPTDPYTEDFEPANDRLPIIDPDFIGPDDIRLPLASKTAFDVWLGRREWVDDHLKALAGITTVARGAHTADWTQLFTEMSKPVSYKVRRAIDVIENVLVHPWQNADPSQFEDLRDALSNEKNEKDSATRKQALQTIKNNLHLTGESFTRLMALFQKDALAASDQRNERLNPREWQEVYGILLQAHKTAVYPTWIKEERLRIQEGKLLFGPTAFWISLAEPHEGEWPPLAVFAQKVRQHPLIDPELITREELLQVMPGKAAVVLWETRQAQLTQGYETKKSMGKDFDAMVKLALGHPNPGDALSQDLTALDSDLSSPIVGVANAARANIANDLYMTEHDFKYLMAIKANGGNATDPEWNETYKLLNSAGKLKRLYPDWIKEEASSPLVDPGVVKEKDLPEALTGAEAGEQWKNRKASLEQDVALLQQAHKQTGLLGLLSQALGHPSPGDNLPHDLTALKAQLETGDPIATSVATEKIGKDLHMPVEDFNRLMFVKTKDDQTDPARKPTASEWVEIYALLTYAQKHKRQYPLWVQKEHDLNLVYWQARKASLPRWRSSVQRRQEWQQALTVRGQSPVIDPDIVQAVDLKDPMAGEATLLWQKRNEWVSKYSADLDSNRKQAEAAAPAGTNKVLAGINRILADSIGVPADGLVALKKDQTEGQDITGRLTQLHLTQAGFSYLVKIRDIADKGKPISDEEWKDVYAILAQVVKQRQFMTWGNEERDKDVLLAPKDFQIAVPDNTAGVSVAPVWEPKAWRATWEARRNWIETLRSRHDQEQAIIGGLTQAVSEAEETNLPMLRDALIMTLNVGGNTVESKAKWVQNHLLIETRASGCHLTTRVGQALTTLQSLLWQLRTNQLPNSDLKLWAPAFDGEWTWIGSYATWRAAMFVFLYPENILLPNLRQSQTPAFRKLVGNLRNNQRLTPDHACQAARAYSDYFRDVCSLSLEACAAAKSHVADPQSCHLPQEGYQDLLFLFARSTVSNKAYWSTRRELERYSGSTQTFWAEIPGMERCANLIGAVPYEITPQGAFKERYLYLFARIEEKREQKLVFTRYDLEKGLWAPEPTELELPEKATQFSAQLRKLDNSTNPPQLALWVSPSGALYSRGLAPNGTEWEERDFNRTFVGDGVNVAASALERVWDNIDNLFDFPTVNAYAIEQGYLGGFPTYHASKSGTAEQHYGIYIKREDTTNLYGPIAPAVDRVISFNDLLAVSPEDPGAGIQERLRALSKYALRQQIGGVNVYAGAFPTYRDPDNVSCHAVLLRREAAYSVDIPRSELLRVWREDPDGAEERFRAISAYALDKGYLGGFPTFHPSTDGTGYHAVLIKRNVDQLESLLEPWLHKRDASGISRPPCDPGSIKPTFTGPFWIPTSLTEPQTQERKKLIHDAFNNNAAVPRSHLTYFEEAWFFVPLQIALHLQQGGHYIAALDWYRTIYDYSFPLKDRKIYHGLKAEESLPYAYRRNENWLQDPLNPHSIAETRRFSYTRFTLLSLIRCFLEYADAEFTSDTPESVVRARRLYESALELLNASELKQRTHPCDELIISLGKQLQGGILTVNAHVSSVWNRIKQDLRKITDRKKLHEVVDKAKAILVAVRPDAANISEHLMRVAEEIAKSTRANTPPTLVRALAEYNTVRLFAHSQLLGHSIIAETSYQVATTTGTGFSQHVASSQIRSMDRLLEKVPTHIFPFLHQPNAPYRFCIPPNPVLKGLRLRAELNKYKILNCRNIAGMERELEPYAAATDTQTGLPIIGGGGELILPGTRVFQPTHYRSSYLIERAKHLAQTAGQIEASMLSALEKRDAEAYNVLKARQDIGLARAGVKLQTLRVKEAKGQIQLAELQQDRARIQVDHYQQLLDEDISANERAALVFMWITVGLHTLAAAGHFYAAYYAVDKAGNIAAGLSGTAAATSTTASILSTIASYERRKQDWEFQRTLAQQDVRIGSQQVKISEDHLGVVGQEQTISQLQADHGEAVLDFLSNKFTNMELYDWMGNTLESVYSYFLQQATAVAKLAESQLAFERHETPPTFIQADYWKSLSEGSGAGTVSGPSPDRRGLTGSVRLLQDIYRLEEYAIETDKRKLQIPKTISLARLAPVEFQRFRETGVITFRTPMEMFDRDFPGHYLRLIKRPPKTSVIALIPPVDGIKATLWTSGLSRVTIGGDVFQTVPVRREPEMVALSSPRDATGLFELEPQSEKLFPFESTGVDTIWEFRMPKAANQFDYSTIADVLLTIEYTALSSFEYREQVIQTLDAKFQADQAFSFRHQFADQWYDIHNPGQTTHPMVVRFKTRRQDFPPNLDSLKIQQVVLYFGRRDDASFEIPISSLLFTEERSTAAIGGGATSVDGVISTRRGNAGSWTAMIGKRPFGEWELALPNTAEMRNRFKNSEIEDMLFVITYSGRTPSWPQ